MILADNSQIVAKLDLKVETDYATRRIVHRRWRLFDLDSFIADFNQSALLLSSPSDVDELFSCYDSTLHSLLDACGLFEPGLIK